MKPLWSGASPKAMEVPDTSQGGFGETISTIESKQIQMREDIKVLLIDDDPVANFINKAVIKEYISNHVEIAINGLQGIRILQEAINKNNCPEFILLDMNMPVMNGIEFLEAFQQLELNSNIKIVILTSYIAKLDTNKVMQFNNIKGWLKKPLTKRSIELLNIII